MGEAGSGDAHAREQIESRAPGAFSASPFHSEPRLSLGIDPLDDFLLFRGGKRTKKTREEAAHEAGK